MRPDRQAFCLAVALAKRRERAAVMGAEPEEPDDPIETLRRWQHAAERGG